MKKYFIEADKIQWEKPTEPKHWFAATAKAFVIAENAEQGLRLGTEKLEKEFYGTGTLLKNFRVTGEADLPVDWSYGYGDARKSGRTGDIGDLVGGNVIR